MMKLEIADTDKNLSRDVQTKAVLNTDQAEYEKRRIMKMKLKQGKTLETRINNLETQMARVCTLLEQLLEK